MSLFLQSSPDAKFALLIRHVYDVRAEQTLASEVGIVDSGTDVAVVLAGSETPGLRLAEGETLSGSDRERIARWLRAQAAQRPSAGYRLQESFFPSPLSAHREHLRGELLRRATLGDIEGARSTYDEIRNIELVMSALEPEVLYQEIASKDSPEIQGVAN